jgi:plasmid maintenance system antidote protein VapI
VNGEELQRRLDGRSYSWLAQRLNVTARAVSYWAHGERSISADIASRVRALLPLSGDH